VFKITFTSSKRTGKTHFYAMFRKIKTKKVAFVKQNIIKAGGSHTLGATVA
jgi:hypothetical protein